MIHNTQMKRKLLEHKVIQTIFYEEFVKTFKKKGHLLFSATLISNIKGETMRGILINPA